VEETAPVSEHAAAPSASEPGFDPSKVGHRLRTERERLGIGLRELARRVINLASGVRWERLTRESDRDVEFLYVVYPVGAESCPEDALTTHGGREYGYVSSGTLGVQVGFERYELGPGGSIAFDSTSPHRLWSIGAEPVHAIWVVIGREADPRTDVAQPASDGPGRA
jgi:mannose-6-phosphate isomerase-like protein (cupin superfamily)